jgi:putative transposase
MGHSTGSHTKFHHRYHIVWSPKYRYKVLHGEVRLRVREIIRQVCAELGVTCSATNWMRIARQS